MEENRYKTKTISTWSEFQDWLEALLGQADYYECRWIFRGVSSAQYPLSTTIEREAARSGLSLHTLPSLERRVMNDFRRRLHHYSEYIPERHNIADWLSLMQHFGAPTRLLDWTYSPYVAIYFAVEKPRDDTCALWAMKSVRYTSDYTIPGLGKDVVEIFFNDEILPKLAEMPEETKRSQYSLVQFLYHNPHRGIFVVNPFKLSERSTIQQSVHLIPGDITQSFEDNLGSYAYDHDNLVKLEINVDSTVRKEFLLHLHMMNINRATLFPGLQGFSESLKTRLAIPEILSL